MKRANPPDVTKSWPNPAKNAAARLEKKLNKRWFKLANMYASDAVLADFSEMSKDEQRAMIAVMQDMQALFGLMVERIDLSEAGSVDALGATTARRGVVKDGMPLRTTLTFASDVLHQQLRAAPLALRQEATEARKGAWHEKQVAKKAGTISYGEPLKSPKEEAQALLALWVKIGGTDENGEPVRVAVDYRQLKRVLACCGVELALGGRDTSDERQNDGTDEPKPDGSGD